MYNLNRLFKELSFQAYCHAAMAKAAPMMLLIALYANTADINTRHANGNQVEQHVINQQKASAFKVNRNEMLYNVTPAAEPAPEQQFKTMVHGLTGVNVQTGYSLNADHMFRAPKRSKAPTIVKNLSANNVRFLEDYRHKTPAA